MRKISLLLCLALLPVMAGCNGLHLPWQVVVDPEDPVLMQQQPEIYSQPVPADSGQPSDDSAQLPAGSEETPDDQGLPKQSPVPVGTLPAGIGGGIYYDVTGDGNDDKCYCNMTGSGMVRVQCIVEDEVNDTRYVLDGYDYSYGIAGVEEGKLIVTEKGPYGYNKPLTETLGTVRIIDDRLVFVADVDRLKTGLIVTAKSVPGKDKDETVRTVTILRPGEEVYSGFDSAIKIESVNKDEIELNIEGSFVEPNRDGTVNLRKEPLKEIAIERGKSVNLVSQTMDAGVRLEIYYK